MKKSKFLCLILAVVFIIVLHGNVICLASNEDTACVETAKNNLTLELLTHQSHYAITKPLNLSSSALNSIKSEYGVSISWSTTDTDVLIVSGNTVSIMRPDADKEVSLVATIRKGNASVEKELSFTVPSKDTFVFESEGFGYPDKEGQYINNAGSRWGKSGNDEYYYSTINNVDGNYVMDAYHPKQNNNAMTPTTCYSFSTMPDSDRITVEFTVTFAEDAQKASQTLYYDILFCGNTDTSPWLNFITKLDIEKANNRSVLYNAVEPTVLTSTLPRPMGEPIRIKYDFFFDDTPTYNFYWNDELTITDAVLKSDITRLSELHFNIQRFGEEGRFLVDDLTVTAPIDGVTATGLTPSSVGALEVNISNNSFSVTSEYDADNTLTQKIGVTTNDNSHLDYYGIWLENKTSGSSTSLLERINADESAPPMINGAYLGANHGPMGPILTVANHGKTYKDIGTYWQAGNNGKNWTLVKIVDANRLQFIGDSWGSGTSAFVNDPVLRANGSSAQTSGTLTSLDGTDEVLNFTAQAASVQIFPSFTNRVQKVYAVTGDKKQEITDFNSPLTLRCDRLILEEAYDITDPTQMAQRLRDGRPTDGSGYASPPDIACGDVVLSYKQTITFMEDGTVITEFDHEFKKDANAFTYYGYQYYMKNNFGGGVKRYIPDTKAFTAESTVYSGRDSFTEGTSKTFDFSVPHQMISGSYFDYPYNAQPEKSTLWSDSSKAPNRVVDYMINSDGSTEMGFANGFLPLLGGANDTRIENTSKAFFFYGSVKAYPIFVSRNATSAGTKVQGVVYRKHDDTAKISEDVQTYSVSYGDDMYFYIDFLADSEDLTLKLPEYFDASSAVCIDTTGVPTHSISGNTVTVSGEQKDYIVLKAKKLPRNEASVNKTFYNMVNGEVQADISNSSADTLTATAVAVCYDQSGKMLTADAVPVSVEGGTSHIVTFSTDFSQGSSCKVFLFKEDSAYPLCINGYTEIN